MQLFTVRKSYNRRREQYYNKLGSAPNTRSVPLQMSTQLPLSDSKILKDSKSSPWMFGMLVDRYQEAFIRKASNILRSTESAEDAVQDTFLKIYKYSHQFQERENANFSSWAYKILTNTCYSYASKRTMELGDMDVHGNLDNSIGNEQISLIQSVLSRLPTKFSRLLSLHFLEGKNYQEIATIENISLGTVKSGLYRAKKQFKNVSIEVT